MCQGLSCCLFCPPPPGTQSLDILKWALSQDPTSNGNDFKVWVLWTLESGGVGDSAFSHGEQYWTLTNYFLSGRRWLESRKNLWLDSDFDLAAWLAWWSIILQNTVRNSILINWLKTADLESSLWNNTTGLFPRLQHIGHYYPFIIIIHYISISNIIHYYQWLE